MKEYIAKEELISFLEMSVRPIVSNTVKVALKDFPTVTDTDICKRFYFKSESIAREHKFPLEYGCGEVLREMEQGE